MKYLVSIIREIEVDAMSLDEAKWRAIEIDGRPGEITHVQAELLKNSARTEASQLYSQENP